MERESDEAERKDNPLADAGAEVGLEIGGRIAVNSADEVAAASLNAAGGLATSTTEMAVSVAEGAMELGAAAAEAALVAGKAVVVGTLEVLGG